MKTKIFEFRNGILDVDGTLLDNKRLYRLLLSRVLPFGFSEIGAGLYLPTGGIPLPGWTKPLPRLPGLTRLVLTTEKVILKLSDIMDSRTLRLYEGTEEVLSQLSQKGISLFATTGSKTQKTAQLLERAGILSFFTALAGSEIPKREHIPYFASRVGLPLEEFAKEAFLVSDGPVDLALASKYGIYPVGITNTLNSSFLSKNGAQEVISHLGELLE